MKRFFTVLLGVLLIAALTAPAFAWEFAMTGEGEFRYRYFSRTGQGDLYGGPAGVGPLGPTGTTGFAGPVYNLSVYPLQPAAPPNPTGAAMGSVAGAGFFGVMAQGFSAKGSDASIQEQRLWLFPEIRVNPAIRFRAEYWVTGTNLRGHYTNINDGRGYLHDTAFENFGESGWYISNNGNNGDGGPAATGMCQGMWEKLWITAQLPWGIFVAGRRGVDFGLGWSSVHEKDLDDETWLMVVPYGPLTLIFGQALRDSLDDPFIANSAATLAASYAYSTAGVPLEASALSAGYDKNRIAAGLDSRIAFTYRNGPVDMGWLFVPIFAYNQHFLPFVPAGPNFADDFTNNIFSAVYLGAGLFNDGAAGAVPMTGDVRYLLSPLYFKYFNGRFFLNLEYGFEYADAIRQGGRPIYTWADEWEYEIGAICGPAKLTFAGFYHSGDDRRGGWLDYWDAFGGAAGIYHAGTNVYDHQSQFIPFGGGQAPIAPYQYLMGIYGSGNVSGFDLRGYGQFTDFLAYAARLDYAVAANLNVFSSFMYANRASNTGTPIGAFRGGAPNTFRIHPGFAPTYNGNYGFVGAPAALGGQTAAIPNVPDNYLGWEWDAGVNWKLLEGLTFNSVFAYWQPGDWFKWAYVDYGGSAATDATINGVTYPVNPNRGIDPIIGFQGSIVVDF